MIIYVASAVPSAVFAERIKTMEQGEGEEKKKIGRYNIFVYTSFFCRFL